MTDINFIHNQLFEAVQHNDISAVRHWVDQIDVVPEYIFVTAVRLYTVEQIAVLAPKCSGNMIYQGLSRAIMGQPQANMRMLHALLPYTDQKICNQAMADACGMHRTAVVDLLYPMCDIQKVLNVLDTYRGGHINFWKTTLRDRMEAEKLRSVLNTEVCACAEGVKRKM